MSVYDLLVVGGGINGCGIAAAASARGFSVLLVEQSDLASATSSASSKLIHGGLRYLEQYAFRLVRESLIERETLLAKAPHLIWPIPFVLPYSRALRPRWLLRTGLFLYDNLAERRKIPRSRALDLQSEPVGRPLRPEFTSGFEYWDCWVDDARLVVANAMAAREAGATILTRTAVSTLQRQDGVWLSRLSKCDGSQDWVSARALVNAAGPWVAAVDALSDIPGQRNNRPKVRLVKGSHLVLPRIPGADTAYLLQSPGKRVVFVLPFEERFSIIGTTDVPYDGDPASVCCSDDEDDYLRDLTGRFFNAPISRSDVLWRYSGVRPLYDDASADPSAVTRDYRLELSAPPNQPPRLSVYGGKITTYRALAEQSMHLLCPLLAPDRTCRAPDPLAPLPGGELFGGDFDTFLGDFFAGLMRDYPSFEPRHLYRLARRHGSRITRVLGDARSPSDMGRHLGEGLYEREVAYLKTEEWARTPQDVLFRRSKLGVHFLATLPNQDGRRLTDDIAALL